MGFNSVITPIYPSSTFAFDGPGKTKGYDYGRTANPTRTALEECLAAGKRGAKADNHDINQWDAETMTRVSNLMFKHEIQGLTLPFGRPCFVISAFPVRYMRELLLDLQTLGFRVLCALTSGAANEPVGHYGDPR